MVINEMKDVGSPVLGASAPMLCRFVGEEPVLIHPRRQGAIYDVRSGATTNDKATDIL